MSNMHINFLEPNQDWQHQLDYSEVNLSQEGVKLYRDCR